MLLFQALSETFFNGKVLDTGPDASLSDLGLLHGQLALSLGIACIVVFVFIAAGTKSIGKVYQKICDSTLAQTFRTPLLTKRDGHRNGGDQFHHFLVLLGALC